MAWKLLAPTLIMSNKSSNNLNVYFQQIAFCLARARDEREIAEIASNWAAEVREYVNAERLSAASRMAGWLAHRLNNSLGAISGNAQLLARRLQRDISDETALPTYLRHVESIQVETERCAQITSNLLSFTRSRSVELGRVDVKQAVEEATILASYNRGKTDIAYGKGLTNGNIYALADKELFVRAIYEVLVNAIQASEGRKVYVDVELVPPESPEWVHVLIADSGPGIPEDILLDIFDPFFSTREKAQGLGLTISLAVMRQMGGSVEVMHTGPEGTVMAIKVPARR